MRKVELDNILDQNRWRSPCLQQLSSNGAYCTGKLLLVFKQKIFKSIEEVVAHSVKSSHAAMCENLYMLSINQQCAFPSKLI